MDYQNLQYYSVPDTKGKIRNLEKINSKLLQTFEKLGVSLNERNPLATVAVDAVFDSVSVGTTFKSQLFKHGVIFCSFNEAVQNYPCLVEKYLGSVVPIGDNFFATLNSSVFSDGSFCYIPKDVKSPLELSSYFRINNETGGQFERTLIIAEERSFISYLEGCTAPRFKTNQLHAAVVELIALEKASIKYSTVQNWYSGNAQGEGGVYNFVTKRGLCRGKESKIS
jgi:Fe-S cluster assembly protein SufB